MFLMLKSLLTTSTLDFALILGIDDYVAKIISGAVNKAIKMLAIQAEIEPIRFQK